MRLPVFALLPLSAGPPFRRRAGAERGRRFRIFRLCPHTTGRGSARGDSPAPKFSYFSKSLMG